MKPAPDGVVISRELFAFLCGDGPMQGHWFGEKPEHEQGNFWWRKALRAADNAMVEAETIKGIILAFIDADDATHWGDFEKALDRAVSAPPAATSDRVEALSKALSLLDTFAGDGIGHTFGNGQTIDADDTVIELAAAFGIEPEPGWWRIVAGEVAQRLGQEFDAGEGEPFAYMLRDTDGKVFWDEDMCIWTHREDAEEAAEDKGMAMFGVYDGPVLPQSRGQAFDGEGEAGKILRAISARMAIACDWTKAGKDHVKVRTADWHVLMEIGYQARALSNAKRGEEG
ncbi:hypothetical protein [Sphingobium yanoikuyae]|uniref:hypothetical protein n=1 Tax=Sphingobium yanoikuyae TaxID=13690 RepID=UPI000F7DE26B|nr:hypothetical protein [Sphingobium yanoikuyae]